MQNPEVTVQIFSGSFLEKAAPYKIVEKKLISCLSRMPVNKVIMGWAPDKELYQRTAEFLTKRNIDFYLWFPVFSETGSLEKLSPLIDIRGQRLECRSDEEFSFCCPNSKNVKKILNIFEREFSSVYFDGVFLDRIRYPSFANSHGAAGVLSCFCPECRAAYKRENFNIENIKAALDVPESDIFTITRYQGNGNYLFKNTALSVFFRLKAKIIYKSLEQMCKFFRERNYGIGFDVFAPFLSPFTGQDLVSLSGLCDFIKPMMYRVTCAPAGLPYETGYLLRQTGAQKQNFYKSLRINQQAAENENSDIEKKSFNLAFSARELKGFSAASACPVYAGIEINRVKNFAEADPAYIEETIKAYAKTGIRGLALSWNLLDMPEENIAKTADLITNLNA